MPEIEDDDEGKVNYQLIDLFIYLHADTGPSDIQANGTVVMSKVQVKFTFIPCMIFFLI